ncbi:hypothetical protein ACJJIQ_01535 [Microbulbifer sp. ANSA003]|uniref:hypothetical protein n=1 Tax=Microbulbifer sp. ANSA003 TaxID=3243360 RepID=UPI0040410583
MEAKDIPGGILLVIGESSSRQCEIKISGASLKEGIGVTSIEEASRVSARCHWDDGEFSQSRKNYTSVAVNINEEKATIDLQLIDLRSKNYLALTKITTLQADQ